MHFRFIALLCLSACASSVLADLTFSTGDPTMTDYFAGGSGSPIFSQNSSGGNPGPWMALTLTWPAGFVADSMGFSPGWSYDPSAGAISSIDFSADILTETGVGRVAMLVLGQGANYYFKNSNIITATGWSHASGSGAEADFLRLDPDTATVIAGSPDFSTAGAPIELFWGFSLYGGSSDTPAGNETLGYDNLNVTLHTKPVPEPASLTALALGLGALVRRRPRTARPAIRDCRNMGV